MLHSMKTDEHLSTQINHSNDHAGNESHDPICFRERRLCKCKPGACCLRCSGHDLKKLDSSLAERSLEISPPFKSVEVQLEEATISMKSNEIPLKFPTNLVDLDKEWCDEHLDHHRNYYVLERRMFALVDQTWTKKLSERLSGNTCLEVCAGSGWLSKALSQHKVNIVATDIEPPENAVFDVMQCLEGRLPGSYKTV